MSNNVNSLRASVFRSHSPDGDARFDEPWRFAITEDGYPISLPTFEGATQADALREARELLNILALVDEIDSIESDGEA